MLTLPNTTTTALYTDAGAAVFPGTDSGALTPFANGFLFVANNPAFISVRVGRTSASSGVWTPDTLVQPTMVPLTVATNVAQPQFIFGVRARDAVAGTHAQVFGALFQTGEVSFVPGNQFSGTVNPAGGFTPPTVAGLISGIVSGAGAVVSGAGFTPVRTGPGAYTINYATAFVTYGAPVVLGSGAPPGNVANINAVSASGFSVTWSTLGGVATDTLFSFVVAGA